MNLDQLLSMLQSIKDQHGGEVPVKIGTSSYHDSDEEWTDIEDAVRKVDFDDRQNICFIKGDQFKVYY